MSEAHEKPGNDTSDEASPARPERQVQTSHTTTIEGQAIAYTATAGTLNLEDAKHADRASVFYVAYVKDGVDDPSTRPVTFCFNGGPGSSAVWLQLGAFGPRRVEMSDAAAPLPPPYDLVDNAFGLLDLTDLVFVDPVGTGFSRPVGKAKGEEFHSVKGDVESVGAFIAKWISRYARWNSPRFLAGESYGTTRAAGLVHHLQERGIVCNGLVLLGLALDFTTFVFEPGNDLPNVLYLPTYAATSWYHDRLDERPPDLHDFLEEVREFAVETYAPALLRGAGLPADRKHALAQRLAAYTGLPAGEIEARDLRIEYLWYAKRVLGEPGRTVGRLDSRFVGIDPDTHHPRATSDPSFDAPIGPYSALINDHLRRHLGWESDDEYEVLSIAVNEAWKWDQDAHMGFPHVVQDLRRALLANPHLKVLVASGLYDLATPFFASAYTVDHLDVDESLRANVRLCWYEAGHMMYVHPPSLAKLRADLKGWYADALGR